MPAFFDWIARHWLESSLILVAALALTFIFVNRKSLFYKE